ncbi:hypothetical protein TNCV_975641 [Trichonephila clavipes]|nr:hypothetical protein TNCV_975641 [Trichonephila clavipes]
MAHVQSVKEEIVVAERRTRGNSRTHNDGRQTSADNVVANAVPHAVMRYLMDAWHLVAAPRFHLHTTNKVAFSPSRTATSTGNIIPALNLV